MIGLIYIERFIMIDFIFILFISYMLILLEKQSTVNLGTDRGVLFSVDLCAQRKVYAPFKYRPLGFWLARLFGVTSDKMQVLSVWAGRYNYNTYLIRNKGLETYYVFKYLLLLFANFAFYHYISFFGLSGLVGVLILDLFLAFTFVHDAIDYLLEVGLYSLFMLAIFYNWGIVAILLITILGGLNRESSIFMIPLSLFYADIVTTLFTIIGFAIGFAIPRYMYRQPVDEVDACHRSGFKFLTFSPIRNWQRSIWPHLKQRFYGMKEYVFIESGGQKAHLNTDPGGRMYCETKERFLNRIFLGVVFLSFFFFLMIVGLFYAPPILYPMSGIFTLFVIMISFPADIREIRVYCPALLVIVPYIMFL